MQTRQVRIGCTFTYVAEIGTPVIFHVQPHSAPDITLAGLPPRCQLHRRNRLSLSLFQLAQS